MSNFELIDNPIFDMIPSSKNNVIRRRIKEKLRAHILDKIQYLDDPFEEIYDELFYYLEGNLDVISYQ